MKRLALALIAGSLFSCRTAENANGSDVLASRARSSSTNWFHVTTSRSDFEDICFKADAATGKDDMIVLLTASDKTYLKILKERAATDTSEASLSQHRWIYTVTNEKGVGAVSPNSTFDVSVMNTLDLEIGNQGAYYLSIEHLPLVDGSTKEIEAVGDPSKNAPCR